MVLLPRLDRWVSVSFSPGRILGVAALLTGAKMVRGGGRGGDGGVPGSFIRGFW